MNIEKKNQLLDEITVDCNNIQNGQGIPRMKTISVVTIGTSKILFNNHIPKNFQM